MTKELLNQNNDIETLLQIELLQAMIDERLAELKGGESGE